jgi:flagellar hook-basal body complex protein FliE
MINLNADVAAALTKPGASVQQSGATVSGKSEFTDVVKGVEKGISQINERQVSSDISVRELLSGRNEDIVSVVAEVAKADMSFKLLVGVRNKLIEAYKQTMNMPV